MKKLLPFLSILISFFLVSTAQAQEVLPQQQTLITKVAATWCHNCGTWGWDVYEGIIEDNPTNAVIITAHYNGTLFTEPARAMATNLGSIGQPQYFLNNQHTGLNQGNASQKRMAIKEERLTNSEELPLANTGANFQIQDGIITANVKVEFFQEGEGAFYLAAYVLENGVMAYQAGKDTVVAHDKLLRASFTENSFGDPFGNTNIASGSTFIKDFSLDISSDWNPENLELVTIIYKKEGGKYIFVNGTTTLENAPTSEESSPTDPPTETETAPIFDNFPWLTEVVNINDCCSNQTVTVYNSGIYQFLFVESNPDCSDNPYGVLYFENGTFYCADASTMNCLQAYGLTEQDVAMTWTCDGGNEMTEETPEEEEEEEEETDPTETSDEPDFSAHPWLADLVDTGDCCPDAKVTAYNSGAFTFVYLERVVECENANGQLYFQDGTFYCQDGTGLDCRTAYGLSEENSTVLWSCDPTISEETVDAGNSKIGTTLNTNKILSRLSSDLAIYPNPTTDRMNLRLNNLVKQNLQINIHTANGQLVYTNEQSLDKGFHQFEISLSDLRGGVYFVSALGDSTSSTLVQKLILLD